VNNFSFSVTSARNGAAPPEVVELLESILAETRAAYSANRARTNPLPLCDLTLAQDPPTDSTGALQSYTKPIILLTDEFSASGGDAFPAMFQDNRRGPVFGMRSMGAGGSVVDWEIGTYSEGATRVTVSLMNRRAPVVTADNKTAPYVENIGVRPDIPVDYMTRDNLLNGGKTYVDAFTAAVVDLIQKSKELQ
jgi:C-terminal processing protease CtpA/Prc